MPSVGFYQAFKEAIIPIIHKLPENWRGVMSSVFYEASIILIPKPGKDITRKENYRPISFMNVHTKILKKY